MAEGLFKHTVRGRGPYRVLSAGVGAVDGQAASDHAVRALREIGIDINGHRSRHLTADLVAQADYIFGMTHSHVDAIMLLYPQAAMFVCGLLRDLQSLFCVFGAGGFAEGG